MEAQEFIQKVRTRSMSKLLHERTYKPKHHFNELKEYFEHSSVEGESYKEIFPAYEQDDTYKEIFGDALSHYVEKEMYRKGDPTVIAKLKDARIDTDNGPSIAVISSSQHVLGEVSFSYVNPGPGRPTYDGKASENNIFHRNYYTKPLKVKGTVFSMLSGGGASRMVYHWFSDALPRFQVLKESGWFEEVDYFLVPNFKYSYQKESLAQLGIPEHKIINGMEHPHVQADWIIVSSHPRTATYFMPQWIIQFIEDKLATPLLAEADKLDFDSPPYIYVSRKDAKHRQILNESEVEAILDEYGFKSYTMSPLSMAERAKLFSKARVVITVHGSNITNMLFSKAQMHLIDLMPFHFVLPFGFEQVRHTQINYDFLPGLPYRESVPSDRHSAIYEDILVDVAKLKSKLEGLKELGILTN